MAAVLVDSGFYSENTVRAIEQTRADQPSGTVVYAVAYAAEARLNTNFSITGMSVQRIMVLVAAWQAGAIEVCLVNARHCKNLPARKTAVPSAML